MLSWSSARAECLPRRTTRGARARLEKLRRPARRCPPAFGGPRRRAGARAGCGCSATSSVVPNGSGAVYHHLPSTTTTAATVSAFARALRGRVLTSCRGCRRCSSDEGRGKGCSGDGRGGEARPATGPLPPPTVPGPCTRRRLAAAFPCLRATRLGSRPCVARCRKKSGFSWRISGPL